MNLKTSKLFRLACWIILYLCVVQGAAEPQSWSNGGWVISGSTSSPAFTADCFKSNVASPLLQLCQDTFGIGQSANWAMINGTTSQGLNIYNTFTSNLTFETLRLNWSANIANIVTLKGPTGTIRALSIGINSGPLSRLTFNTDGSQDFTLGTSGVNSYDTNGHAIFDKNGQFTPAISACGAGPSGSAVGDDNAGIITVGGGAVTSCTLTFSNAWPTNAPACTLIASVTTATLAATTTTSVLTITSSATVGGATIMYRCAGYN